METNLDIIISLITGRNFFLDEQSSEFLKVQSYLFEAYNKEHIRNTGSHFITFTTESETIAREFLLSCHPQLRELANLIMGIADKDDNKVMRQEDYRDCVQAINDFKIREQDKFIITQIPADFKIEQPKIRVLK